MTNDSYEHIRPGHPSYERIKANQECGNWICDSVDHNEGNSEGYCSNPECFKSKNPPKEWNNFVEDIDKFMEELFPHRNSK